MFRGSGTDKGTGERRCLPEVSCLVFALVVAGHTGRCGPGNPEVGSSVVDRIRVETKRSVLGRQWTSHEELDSGGCIRRLEENLKEYVQRSTELTHSDPKALYGAMAIALAAYQSATVASVSAPDYLEELAERLRDVGADEFLDLVHKAVRSAKRGEPTAAFAAAIGSSNGISGYVYHTVPCVIQTWLRHADDFAGGVQEIISGGGDTDTTGAILGAILGARVGKHGIPEAWLNAIIEWPRSIKWIERLGGALAAAMSGHHECSCPAYFTPGIIFRNAFFLIVVLAHGFRRLAPPY